MRFLVFRLLPEASFEYTQIYCRKNVQYQSDVDLPEQRHQLVDGVAGDDDFRIDRTAVPLPDHLQCRLEARTGAAREIEGDAALSQALGDQLAGVAAATVDQHLAFLGHVVGPRKMSCSITRPRRSLGRSMGHVAAALNGICGRALVKNGHAE